MQGDADERQDEARGVTGVGWMRSGRNRSKTLAGRLEAGRQGYEETKDQSRADTVHLMANIPCALLKQEAAAFSLVEDCTILSHQNIKRRVSCDRPRSLVETVSVRRV